MDKDTRGCFITGIILWMMSALLCVGFCVFIVFIIVRVLQFMGVV